VHPDGEQTLHLKGQFSGIHMGFASHSPLSAHHQQFIYSSTHPLGGAGVGAGAPPSPTKSSLLVSPAKRPVSSSVLAVFNNSSKTWGARKLGFCSSTKAAPPET